MLKPKFFIPLVVAISIFLGGCNNQKTINGKTYSVYGLFNEDEKKNPNVKYRISVASVIVAIIFIETGFVPIYVIGWDLWEPVGLKSDPEDDKGVVK